MNRESVEERYFDVLQNIEFAIVQVYRRHPDLADANVDRALEALLRAYNAELKERSTPKVNLSATELEIRDDVRAMCEWRLGRVQPPDNETPKEITPITVDEIIICLKRLRSSIKLWTQDGGRQGYLTFISPFLK